MLMTEVLRQKVVNGEKIQTRRPAKSGDELRFDDDTNERVIVQNGRIKIAEGSDYAIQYGRGKPTCWWRTVRRGELPIEHQIMPFEQYQKLEEKHGKSGVKDCLHRSGYKPLRILITDIRREDVRKISCEDAEAEGFDGVYGFWRVWCGFYDKPVLNNLNIYEINKRPDELYQAWAYTFEVLR